MATGPRQSFTPNPEDRKLNESIDQLVNDVEFLEVTIAVPESRIVQNVYKTLYRINECCIQSNTPAANEVFAVLAKVDAERRLTVEELERLSIDIQVAMNGASAYENIPHQLSDHFESCIDEIEILLQKRSRLQWNKMKQSVRLLLHELPQDDDCSVLRRSLASLQRATGLADADLQSVLQHLRYERNYIN